MAFGLLHIVGVRSREKGDLMLEIRKAVIEDAKDIAIIQTKGWQSEYKDLIESEVLNSFTWEKKLPKWKETLAHQDEHAVFIALVDSRAVGFISGGKSTAQPSFDAELCAICILNEFQNRSIGTLLFQHFVEWLRVHQFRSLFAWVDLSTRSYRFYDSLGATCTSVTKQCDISPAISLECTAYAWRCLPQSKINEHQEVRSAIKDLVLSIKPLDQTENEHVEFILGWLDSPCQIFRTAKPATPDPHLVSYFVVIDKSANKILLVDHKKAELWLPPGGHVEVGEHPMETVKREAWEELQLEAKFVFNKPIFSTVTTTVGPTAGHTDVSLWFVLEGDSLLSLEYDREEFNRIEWFDLDNLPYHRSDPHMRRFVEKIRTALF